MYAYVDIVFACLFFFVHTRIDNYIYIHTYIYIHMYIYTHVYVHVYVYVYVSTHKTLPKITFH